MRYYITNGDLYLRVFNKTNKFSYEYTSNINNTSHFKKSEAIDILHRLDIDEHWGLRKLFSAKSGKNYVITTGNLYISDIDGEKITTKYSNAKPFRSILDASVYVRKHSTFKNSVIIDDHGNVIDVEIKKFTPEQLNILGVTKEEKNDNVENKRKRVKIDSSIRSQVYSLGNGVCAICGRSVSYNEFTIDHIVPLARGGLNRLDNFQIACRTCNTMKKDSKNSEFMKSVSAILANNIDDYDDEKTMELVFPVIRSYIRKAISKN